MQKRFFKTKIKLDNSIINKISSSEFMTDSEKLSFMKYVGYMTEDEKRELSEVI